MILGFVSSKAELRSLKRQLIRSNTRGVYKSDDDDRWVAGHPEIQRIAQALGYELVRTDLFRTRFATATREQLREEVVVLRYQQRPID